MKHNYFIRIWQIVVSITVVGMILNVPVCMAIDAAYETITFKDKFQSQESTPVRVPMLDREYRMNRVSSKIVVNSQDLNEDVLKSLNYAISVWESYLLTADTVLIEVKIEDINSDILTEVRYDMVDSKFIPSSLRYFLDKNLKRDSTYPDGIIVINSTTNWDYNINAQISPKGKNLAHGLMRAIARILGFGSSVAIDNNDNYRFCLKRGYSVFDELISNSSGIKLTSVPLLGGQSNGNLYNFIHNTNQHFWVITDNSRYQLASPPYDVNNMPFTFLEDSESLMRKSISEGSFILQIDEATRSILNMIGWNNVETSIVKIISDEIPNTGNASAYTCHDFKIESGSYKVSNPKWELKLPLKNGSTEIISLEDRNLSCTTPAIINENKYLITQDSNIEGRLEFSGSVNGKQITALPFKIYFELKPEIEYAQIEKIVSNAPLASYNAFFRVKYRGASRIKVSVEEEYSSAMKTLFVDEPYIAEGEMDYIVAPYYAWMDFTAENSYGKAIYTIELGPNGVVLDSYNLNRDTMDKRQNMRNNNISDEAFTTFNIYNVYGNKIGNFESLSKVVESGIKGLVIIHELKGNEVVNIYKMDLK